MKLVYRFDNIRNLVNKGEISDITIGDDFIEVGFAKAPAKYTISILKGDCPEYELRALDNFIVASKILQNPMKTFELPKKCDLLEIIFSNDSNDFNLLLKEDDLQKLNDIPDGPEDNPMNWVEKIELYIANLTQNKNDKDFAEIFKVKKKFNPRNN